MKKHYNIKVGTKLYHKENPSLIYEIYHIDDHDYIYVKWRMINMNIEEKIRWCHMINFISYLRYGDCILLDNKLTYEETL